MDNYQERYLEHQKRKKETLMQIIRERHSERAFTDYSLTADQIEYIIEAADRSPSSCNRQGVNVKIIRDRDQKEILSALLVGGVGWAHRADTIFLLRADPLAYKAHNEVEYNPFLDSGVKAQNILLACQALDLKACFINPTIRKINQDHYDKIFGQICCGAVAVGK